MTSVCKNGESGLASETKTDSDDDNGGDDE